MKFRLHPQALSGKEIASLVTIFFCIFFSIAYSQLNPEVYAQSWIAERGYFKNLSNLGILIGSLVCFYRAYVLRPFRVKLFSRFLSLWGLIFLGLFFERVFLGLSLDVLAYPVMLFLVGFYFFLLPIIYRNLDWFQVKVDEMAISVPKWIHMICLLLLVFIVYGLVNEGREKILEFGVVWIFVILSLRPYNRELFSRRSESY